MALAPILRNLRLSERLHGQASSETVQARLLLAKAHLGLHKYLSVRTALADLTAAVSTLLKDALPHGTDLTGLKRRKTLNTASKTAFQVLSGP